MEAHLTILEEHHEVRILVVGGKRYSQCSLFPASRPTLQACLLFGLYLRSLGTADGNGNLQREQNPPRPQGMLVRESVKLGVPFAGPYTMH